LGNPSENTPEAVSTLDSKEKGRKRKKRKQKNLEKREREREREREENNNKKREEKLRNFERGLIRKGSWRLSSSNDPFNPTIFLVWICCHSLILNCCHSIHLFVFSFSLSLFLSDYLYLFFSLLFFSLPSALSLSTAEGGS